MLPILCGSLIIVISNVLSVAAQSTTGTIEEDQIQLRQRLDSLSVQLREAQESIAQQQALIDIMIQTPSTPAATPTAPTGTTMPGQVVAPQQASNLLNPNISLIGDFRANMGRDFEPDARAFQIHEAKIGIQAPIDPYARADAFIAISPEEGVAIEETYMTFQTLPLGLQLKVGKFRSNFGKFNRIHLPETPFADRPLVTEIYLGEEGLAGVGVSLNLLIPNPWVYLNLDVEATSIPEESPAFGAEPPPDPSAPAGEEPELITGGRRRDLMYLSRLGTFLDINESSNLTLGGSYATGVYDEAGRLRTHLQGLDMIFRWQPPRRAIYQSLFWQTELLFSQREMPGGTYVNSLGLFSYFEWQFLRLWHVGARYDYTEMPDSGGSSEQGGLGFLAFAPSEFGIITAQARAVRRLVGKWHGVGMIKLTFHIGPHGAHPF